MSPIFTFKSLLQFRGTWMAQLIKQPTLGFCSGHDLIPLITEKGWNGLQDQACLTLRNGLWVFYFSLTPVATQCFAIFSLIYSYSLLSLRYIPPKIKVGVKRKGELSSCYKFNAFTNTMHICSKDVVSHTFCNSHI